MRLMVGDLWSEESIADIIFVTCNAYVSLSGGGYLVMGRGAAKEAADRYRGLSFEFGDRVLKARDENFYYGVVWATKGWQTGGGPPIDLGAFQVKVNWKDDASLDLIRRSTEKLRGIIPYSGWKRIAMNFPGIGNGRLRMEDVLPIISELPDEVLVYRKP